VINETHRAVQDETAATTQAALRAIGPAPSPNERQGQQPGDELEDASAPQEQRVCHPGSIDIAAIVVSPTEPPAAQ
jgi:hypothetical protein